MTRTQAFTGVGSDLAANISTHLDIFESATVDLPSTVTVGGSNVDRGGRVTVPTWEEELEPCRGGRNSIFEIKLVEEVEKRVGRDKGEVETPRLWTTGRWKPDVQT